jgi:phosphomannomutase
MDDADLRRRAQQWAQHDPDPDTAETVRRWLAADDLEALRRAFAAPLGFGTAGLRGPLGAGPARMNRAVVRRLSAGLAARLRTEPRAAERGVVIAGDHRHGSQALADEAAAVLAGAGLEALRIPGAVPTPLLAFAVGRLDAAAGVMVTASHNPASDNGCKLYWGDGAQVRPPLDAEIAAAADTVHDLAAVATAPEAVRRVNGLLAEGHLDACAALAPNPPAVAVRIVHTPLHGTAGATCLAALRRAGFADVHEIAEQADPDPDFPTVAHPNPEREGALDLALTEANRVGADLVLATDPDGDRLGVAVPDRDGGWRQLSGDEVGCLLGEHLLARDGGVDAVVATTVVSSRLLGRIAAAHGAEYVETLTGFKWLAPQADRAAARGKVLRLAYEQALGYMVTPAVGDKDGIAAAVAVADLAADVAARGMTLPDELDRLARRHGLHHTGERTLPLASSADAAALLARLRASLPTTVDGVAVAAVADYAAGQRRTADGALEALGTPPAELLGVELADGSRLQARPSGTEALLKCYAEVVEPVGDTEAVAVARRRAEQRLASRLAALIGLLERATP